MTTDMEEHTRDNKKDGSMEEKKDEDHHHHDNGGLKSPKSPSLSEKPTGEDSASETKNKTTKNSHNHSQSIPRQLPTATQKLKPSSLSTLTLLHAIIQTGLKRKSSPLHLSSWIQTSLTLDGRDKITKIIQYTSRFLSWYYFHGKPNNFKELQTHLTASRKSYRLGRSIHELYKLWNVGWQKLLWFHFCNALHGLEGEEKVVEKKKTKLMMKRASSSIASTPVILEESNENGDDNDDSDNDEDRKSSTEAAAQPKKQQSESPRLHLPRRVSADIGWGPSSTFDDEEETNSQTTKRRSFYRSLSDLGSKMYRPLSSFTTIPPSQTPPTPPTWKVIGTSLKLLGLAAFFAGDNLSYLSTFGFLDDSSHSSQELRLRGRKERKKQCAHFAMKSYFMACLVGFVLNAHAVITYWNGTLREELDQMTRLEDKGKEDEDEGERRRKKWEEVKGRQFVLLVALFKSCCDIVVFSNNPGVDLHLKYRGKKMNEGFHSLCGIFSACTVLYNNFPNSSVSSTVTKTKK